MTYTDDNRGTIQFRERKKQLIDFSGLRFGTITPTDCDGLIEYRDKANILFEIKHRDADVPKGQLLALTRAIDDWRRAKKTALLVIAEHDIDNPDHDIDAAACHVRTFYFRGRWYRGSDTLKNLIDRFISFVDRKN